MPSSLSWPSSIPLGSNPDIVFEPKGGLYMAMRLGNECFLILRAARWGQITALTGGPGGSSSAAPDPSQGMSGSAHEGTLVGIAPDGRQTRHPVCLSDSLRDMYFT